MARKLALFVLLASLAAVNGAGSSSRSGSNRRTSISQCTPSTKGLADITTLWTKSGSLAGINTWNDAPAQCSRASTQGILLGGGSSEVATNYVSCRSRNGAVQKVGVLFDNGRLDVASSPLAPASLFEFPWTLGARNNFRTASLITNRLISHRGFRVPNTMSGLSCSWGSASQFRGLPAGSVVPIKDFTPTCNSAVGTTGLTPTFTNCYVAANPGVTVSTRSILGNFTCPDDSGALDEWLALVEQFLLDFLALFGIEPEVSSAFTCGLNNLINLDVTVSSDTEGELPLIAVLLQLLQGFDLCAELSELADLPVLGALFSELGPFPFCNQAQDGLGLTWVLFPDDIINNFNLTSLESVFEALEPQIELVLNTLGIDLSGLIGEAGSNPLLNILDGLGGGVNGLMSLFSNSGLGVLTQIWDRLDTFVPPTIGGGGTGSAGSGSNGGGGPTVIRNPVTPAPTWVKSSNKRKGRGQR